MLVFEFYDYDRSLRRLRMLQALAQPAAHDAAIVQPLSNSFTPHVRPDRRGDNRRNPLNGAVT